MTDITELVKRLRASDAHPLSIHGQTMIEAADALEAQEKKIEKLTKVAVKEVSYWATETGKRDARIAELEAALKPFEEKSSKSLADAEKLAANEGYELPDDQTAEDIYAWALALTWGDLRAASAALNAES